MNKVNILQEINKILQTDAENAQSLVYDLISMREKNIITQEIFVEIVQQRVNREDLLPNLRKKLQTILQEE